MELELKHLAPYLPYGLKGVVSWEGNKDFTVALYGVNYSYLNISNPFGGDDFVDIEDFKPILRPLSDLTREIEHNGEKFVPLDWFNHRSAADYFDGNIWVSFLFEDHKCNDLDLLPYGMIQKLLEWHFDIYGLIESGVAVDINTLKTQEL